VLRVPLLALVAALVLALGVASSRPTAGCPGRPHGGQCSDLGQVARRALVQRLSLKLRKAKLSVFYVCATYNAPARPRRVRVDGVARHAGHAVEDRAEPGQEGAEAPGEPGWGLVAAGDKKIVGTELSNLVTGDNFGTFKYRARCAASRASRSRSRRSSGRLAPLATRAERDQLGH
jgi:hypothetical protein